METQLRNKWKVEKLLKFAVKLILVCFFLYICIQAFLNLIAKEKGTRFNIEHDEYLMPSTTICAGEYNGISIKNESLNPNLSFDDYVAKFPSMKEQILLEAVVFNSSFYQTNLYVLLCNLFQRKSYFS